MVEGECVLIELREDECNAIIGYSTRDKVNGRTGQFTNGNADDVFGDCGRGRSNVNLDELTGGMGDVVSVLIDQSTHRFRCVDPVSGRIIGAIAGNELFNLGGKHNKLGKVGKVVLDNIISERFERKVVTWPTGNAPSDVNTRSNTTSGCALMRSPFDYHTNEFIEDEPSVHPRSPSQTRRVGALDFYAERDRCLRERRLFEDPEFPASDKSLFFSKSKAPRKRVEWKRPGEIIDAPQLIYEGQSRFDVVQGDLNDCWLLAAAADLTLRDELFYRVVPPDQSFTENYAGIFHFQFWQYGHWVDVVVDDRLPTSNGELLYMHSKEHNEFWSALLEKAYAKLYGSYEALNGGITSEALEDMTGGLTEFYDLREPPDHLLEMMMRGFEMGSLFGCCIEADPFTWLAQTPNGLVKGHAYGITGMRIVNGRRGRIPLLRIRNPWGNECEWKGPWSDGSPEWQSISQQEKDEMDLDFAYDGEFWMSFDDFMCNFEKIDICNLGPDVMDEIARMTGVRTDQQTWATVIYDDAWIKNETAGGCRNYIDTFVNNPQFRIHLTDSDPYKNGDLCTVIIAVMQKYRRELKYAGIGNVGIGFEVYDANGISGRLDEHYFRSHKPCARGPAFFNIREVTARIRVPPGDYVIIPSTFEPNQEAQFLLRIYTNGFIESEEL